MKKALLLALLLFTYSASPASERRERVNFDFGWQFHLGECPEANAPGFKPEGWQWEDVQLPHDWSIHLPFDRNAGGSSGYLPGGTGLYRKSFTIPASDRGRSVSIIFDGVYHKSTVYLNGHKIGYHRYGYTGFGYDLTPYIKYGQENVLSVHVDHAEESRWYTGSGIYRHVWLEKTDPVHITVWGTSVTTPHISVSGAEVETGTSVANTSSTDRSLSVTQTVVDKNGVPLKASGKRMTVTGTLSVPSGDTSTIRQHLSIPDPHLWSTGDPHTYRLRTDIKEGGRTLDTYFTDFGIRYYEFDADSGFSLNGSRMKLKGVCLHQDAGSFGTAVPDRSYERRLQILKEFGCNAIRCSHNPPSPEFLRICDTLGFLVIDEAFDKWDSGYYAQFYATSWRKDISDMILRDRNHPSVIIWSIGNEVQEAFDDSIGPARAAQMQDYVHSIDPTRPVIVAGQQGFTDAFGSVTDLMGYNYLENRLVADHGRFPDRKMLITEAFPFYSGLRQNDVRDYVDYAPWNYVERYDFLAGSFLWAGADYIGEASAWPSKGWCSCPFDMCMFEKPEAAYLRSVWNGTPMMKIMVRDNSYDIPAGKDHWQYPPMADNWMLPYTDQRCVEVRTVTNCDEVRLFGPHWDGSQKDFGIRRRADYDNNTIIWNQPYRKERMVYAVAYKEGREICRDTLRAHGPVAAVQAVPDRSVLRADGQDLSHITVRLLDENGLEAQTDNRMITASVSGSGALRFIDSGDMRREGSFCRDSVMTYFGKALIVVQSTRNPGPVEVDVRVEGFEKPFSVKLETR